VHRRKGEEMKKNTKTVTDAQILKAAQEYLMSITIEVKRERQSVTQGTATIYINDNKVLSFGDDMYLENNDGTFTNGFNTVENARHYGPVIGGWGSIKPDSDFIMGLIYHSELFRKAVFAADEK
jgi:hypothetical protein